MKIAVYTIAKNESQFVERWFNSAKAADYLLIADTGSTDDTVAIAQRLGINVISIDVTPWRFDKARNQALAALPLDIDMCIALDMDEILINGWRQHLESIPANVTRPRYSYTWSWNADGTPGLVYGGDKIHFRHRYRWKHPVHEVLVCEGKEVQHWIGLEIHHHPDHTKSRGQYFPLLELSVQEDPSDDRNAYYFARELFFNGMYERAAAEFKRHLALPKARWAPERAASLRYLAKCEPDNAINYLIKASEEAPEFREPWVELAFCYYMKNDWVNCFNAAERALAIKEKPLVYLNEADAWGSKPHDLLAISAYQLGKLDTALEHGTIAVELSPHDERLQKNLDYYRAALQKGST